MKTIEPSKKERKQISFNISADDHEMVKKCAAEERMTMRVWIINAMAEKIRRDSSIKKEEIDTFIKELWPS